MELIVLLMLTPAGSGQGWTCSVKAYDPNLSRVTPRGSPAHPLSPLQGGTRCGLERVTSHSPPSDVEKQRAPGGLGDGQGGGTGERSACLPLFKLFVLCPIPAVAMCNQQKPTNYA